jgi:hypothetical protein
MTVTSMIWDSRLLRFFISLQTQAGAGPTDGTRSIVVGFMTPHGLQLYPIAPASAFNGTGDPIVGMVGPLAQVSIQNIATMHTSTALPYLIVQGDVGAPGTTSQAVYALPLVIGSSIRTVNGTIAQKTSQPVDVFSSLQFFLGRSLANPALTPADMPQASDVPVQVGGSPLPYGPITDLFVQTDTVFVTVGTAIGGNQPGMFSSQALFAENGLIIGWTEWQRVIGTTNAIMSMDSDPNTGNYTWIANNQNNIPSVVKRSVWSTGDPQGFGSLQPAIQTNFPATKGGIQGMVDFPFGSAGLNNIAMLSLLSNSTVMLVQTGLLSGGVPLTLGGTAFDQVITFPQAEVTETFPVGTTRVVVFEQGFLSQIGPVITAATGVYGTNGWLFVGGTGGVAILSAPDGTGWNTATGLGDLFTGLTAGMTFKQFLNYSNVLKLTVDGQFLYVLTINGLDRIDLSDPALGVGSPQVVTIAANNDLPFSNPYTTFLDFAVSAQVGLLGTSIGLFRNQSGTNASMMESVQSSAWTFIPMTENVGPIQKIFPISTTGLATDYARGPGGNIYVLNAARSQNRGRVYRFAIGNAENGVTDTTVMPFDDVIIQNIPAYFANLGEFKSLFFTDGALFLDSHDQDGPFPFSLRIFASLPPKVYVQVGQRSIGYHSQYIPLVNTFPLYMTGLLRSIPAGSYITSGNYGMRINE